METGPVSAISVANYLIKKSHDEGKIITPMKLLKLVYIAHGWSLAILDKPLIRNEIEAWRYGPVIPDLYREFKDYKDKNITHFGSEYVWSNEFKKYIPTNPQEITNDETIALLDKIWEVYGGFSGWQLSALTHKPDTPWSIVWESFGKDNNFGNATIGDDIIAYHYKNIASNNRDTNK